MHSGGCIEVLQSNVPVAAVHGPEQSDRDAFCLQEKMLSFIAPQLS